MIEDLSKYMSALNSCLNEQRILLGERRAFERELGKVTVELRGVGKQSDLVKKAAEVFSYLIDSGQNAVLEMMRNVSSAALSEVFGRPISVVTAVSTKRGLQCLEIMVGIDGAYRDPKNSIGGGIADVLGFILQFMLVKLTHNVAPVLILDEPFRNVAKQYHEALGCMVVQLSESTGVQVVMITHETGLIVGDKKYMVEHDGSKSTVTLME